MNRILVALAQTGPSLPDPTGAGTIPALLGRVLEFLLRITIAVTPIIIVIGGLQMLFAAGNAEKINKAKQTITYAVIGLIIALIGEGLIALLEEIILRF
ncbi:MAG: hypothetical protein COU08_00830 [Candidatus Harrisonbacteria bacterium CG10_big_fil_rev_8_21_14_0_10_42_17]|uniref:Uncharacterized protein n=1 Tax=Candidatus Harrisonbacteria bacterium CG10_big_fil_rev_8_21_14_0_10_42_17 TaxID=1974584 RepID=A0A2M6WIS0_9BACT|nr:MAG: hypothetical protein COU08_00830 [Candidatus Harrisonbacteria bacterium CG10_big_fil_rev_8_21_14_0_10_42_17]